MVGRGLRLVLCGGRGFFDCVQAFAAWQWYNYCASQVPVGKTILRINMDEMAVCVFQGGRRGNVFISRAAERIQHATLNMRRTYMSFVAFICDDPSVQPFLPQFVIANKHTLTEDELAAVQASCPRNVFVLRMKTAWVTNAVCEMMMRRLRVALAPFMRERQPILTMDTASPHISSQVLWVCGGLGLWVVIVPALLTWLLQPLDTDAFSLFKTRLQAEYLEAHIRAAGGVVGVRELIASICVAVRYVLQGRRWADVFERDGFGSSQGSLGQRVVSALQLDGPLAIPSHRPSLAQLKVCFPSNRIIPAASIWRAFDAPPAVVVALRLPRARRL